MLAPQVILLDGCVQLRTLPKSMTKLASLKLLSLVNCHLLFDEELNHMPSSCKIERKPAGSPRATPR